MLTAFRDSNLNNRWLEFLEIRKQESSDSNELKKNMLSKLWSEVQDLL